MKKRLLSAALALAMVLTLLPFSAMPASAAAEYQPIGTSAPKDVVKTYDKDGNPKSYYYEVNATTGAITTVRVDRFTGGNDGTNRVYGEWYWLDNKDSQHPQYYKVDSGFIAGNNGSGLWYPDLTAFTTKTKINYNGSSVEANKLRSTSLTLLGSGANLDMSSGYWADTTLNVDIEGSGTLTLAENATNVTVTSKFQATRTGTVAAISRTHSAYATTAPGNCALTLSATNVTVTSINLVGRANNVTLDNCSVGAITMNGAYYTSAANQTANNFTYAGQKLTTRNNTAIGSSIEINGDSNTVSIADTSAGNNTLSVTGNGSVSISGKTTLGNITASARGTTGAYPTVSVSGGTVGDITQGTVAGNKNSFTLNVSNTNTQTGDITVDKGTVNLTNANVNGGVTVNAGALNATQDNVHVSGTLTVGAVDATTLNLSATNSTYGGITATVGANVKISGWNDKRLVEGGGSNYGTVALDGYAGGGITGGSFDANQTFEIIAKKKWLSSSVQFYVKNDKTSTRDLYDNNELARAISDITTDNAKTSGNIIVVAQANDNQIVLKNGQNVWAQIGYNASTGLILPESINGMQIAQWYSPENHDIILKSGTIQGVPLPASSKTTLELNASGVTAQGKRIINATTSSTNTVENRDIRVSLNGNTIALSGAVQAGAGGIATIYVDLTTDAFYEDGKAMKLEKVAIDYYPDTKMVKFNQIQPSVNDAGGVIQEDGAVLVLNNGTGERYTVSASLTVSAGNLSLYNLSRDTHPIVVTTGGKLSSWSNLEKQDLINQMQTNGSFTIENNRAVLEAINAAQATITSDNTVSGWVTSAKNAIWRSGYKSGNTTLNTATGGFAMSGSTGLTPNSGAFDSTTAQGGAIASLFSTAYIVPYLVVNVTDYDRNGALTATLTPYYRVDVSGATYSSDFYYTVQQGRAMSALTGIMCPDGVKVNLGLDSAFASLKMHQDGKYVYTGKNGEWTITHAGTGGNGLGSIVINNIEGPISMESDIASRVPTIAQLGCTYDTLQAAVDDTVRGNVIQSTDGTGIAGVLDKETADTIKIDGNYTGSCAVTMTGTARKVKINAIGQQAVTATGAGVAVNRVDTQTGQGYAYVLELKQDTAPAGGNITVASATGGTARVSANPASAGQTVTVTLSPASGYSASGVTVKDGTGKTISTSGSGTTYTFTMPSGTVTVTPSFTRSQTTVTKATVSVSSTSTGTAVTSAGNNQVDAGTTVTVTTSPASGQRTMGLNVTGTTATRTGVNTFQFTVPSGYSNVVVTPRFDTNNGTNFSDVWSSEYYSAPVAWAVARGITDGTGTYTFSPGSTCNRVQMVTFLWRAAGRPSTAGMVNPFYDVSPSMGSDFYNAIIWANNKGITTGDGNAYTFNPYKTVTRGEAVTFLWRYAGKPAASASNGFYDVSSNDYFAQAVTWANNSGITNGDGSTVIFNPYGSCLRAQIVTFLYRQATGTRA